MATEKKSNWHASMDERVFHNGLIMRRVEVVAELRQAAHSESFIDAYMRALEVAPPEMQEANLGIRK